jgi:hypothetical protein
MRLVIGLVLVALCVAQEPSGAPTLKIPPVKTSLNLEGQPVGITAWGAVSRAPSGVFALSVTVDLSDFQAHLTPVLAAQLNRSDRCGERLSVERAILAPAAPAGILTAYVHYERYGCMKALGKEVVKKLVGGDATLEVVLTPSVAEGGISLAAQVRNVQADGSLGELLRSGQLGDSIRQKIASSVESAVRKSADLKPMLPPQLETALTIRSARFEDGGDGRVWLTVAGQLDLSADQLRGISRIMEH